MNKVAESDFSKATYYITLIIGGLLLMPILGCSSSITEKPDLNKPNIIIIYADDIGYGDVGAYGAELVQTPNLDKIAANGIRFTSAYATSAMCSPSRYSLLTGEYAFRLPGSGILSAEDPLIIEPGSFTLPEMLRQAGYRTSIIGKWHLGLGDEVGTLDWNTAIKPGPLEVGFDESFLLPVTNDRVPTVYVDGHYVHNLSPDDDPLLVAYPAEGHHAYQEERFGDYDDPVDIYQPLVGDLPTGLSHPELLLYPADVQHSGTIVNGISRIGHMAGGQSAWWDDEDMPFEFTRISQDFIKENKNNPFFLLLSMPENHVPRIPHPDFLGTSPLGLRGDAIHQFDWVVGAIIETLEEQGLLENTIVLFSSDNGPVLYDGYDDGALENHKNHKPNGPFRGGKYIAFEGGTRMPTLVQWPAGIESGLVSDAIISQVDFLATFAALTGIDLPEGVGIDSQNLLPAFLGESDKGRVEVVQQSSDGLGIRKGDWKYIPPSERSDWGYNRHNLGDSNAMHVEELTNQAYLFNLGEDPGETQNLIEDYPEIAEELAELLDQIVSLR